MPNPENTGDNTGERIRDKHNEALEYVKQAGRLGQFTLSQENEETGSTQAVEARFVTPLDPVVETAKGSRLPAIPIEEALKLNRLKDQLEGYSRLQRPAGVVVEERNECNAHGARQQSPSILDVHISQDDARGRPLSEDIPPSRTNPLFPPLPIYGPPSLLRTLQCRFFRVVSAFLSLGFLCTIVIGALVEAVPRIIRHISRRARFENPKKRRPFYEEEKKRAQERRAAEKAWVQQRNGQGVRTPSGEKCADIPQDGEFIPTEGGPDPLIVDVAYYARRVGLDAETIEVETEDGFIIELWHIFNPRDCRQSPHKHRPTKEVPTFQSGPQDARFTELQRSNTNEKKKYPVLMIHGLLQSSGAYCTNDDDSLAFYLAKSGYDIWLGNNRCGFHPKHTLLSYEDPRMWAWNIRQMGVMDLPAMISKVLQVTGFPKLALIAHSQGTTQTFVALAKEQRPEIGEKISVFCALAPAAYAGPLIGKIYFKVMRLISPSIFRLIFGIHAFIPLMMQAHKVLPASFYGWIGYHVFSFLFSWSDSRWDRGLRNRMFQWAPVYVSAESMRWWLGRECFAKHKCILATREEGRLEDKEDEEDDEVIRRLYVDREPHVTERRKLQRNLTSFHCQTLTHQHHDRTRGKFAWYNSQFPPLALWVCGADDLVDGRRLLRRFDRGREPYVRIVHKKIIEGYEHLDVIWAMDAIEKVGKEVREVIWRTADSESQNQCKVPVGCKGPLEEDPDFREDVPMMHSGGRLRMASISESGPPACLQGQTNGVASGTKERVARDFKGEDGALCRHTKTLIDQSEEWEGEHDFVIEEEKQYGDRISEAIFTDLQERENPLG